MKNFFRLGVLAASLFVFLGCAAEKPESTEAETQEMHESTDYESDMMGMGDEGGAAEPAAN